mmetsp:Transcript_6601/g.17741  ORF Transcript_6601/g.17741 Transcript_6601/m.17741 type:complete len:338 (+) Transcript_6601:89-1102(+)
MYLLTSMTFMSSNKEVHLPPEAAQVKPAEVLIAFLRMLDIFSLFWKTPTASSMALTTVRTSAGSTSLSGSSSLSSFTPVSMWLTVSFRPPVGATIGSVPNRMDSICTRPHGSYRLGISAKSAPAYTWNFSAPLNARTALYCAGCFSCSCFASATISAFPPPIMTIWRLVCDIATSSAAIITSTPFCTSRRPRKHMSGAAGSTGRSNFFCNAALHRLLSFSESRSKLAASPAFIFMVALLGVMLSLRPLRIPITPPRALATFSSSTPFSSVVSISSAYVSDTVAMRSAYKKPPSIQLRQSTRGWRLPTLSGIITRIWSIYICGRFKMTEWFSWYGARP